MFALPVRKKLDPAAFRLKGRLQSTRLTTIVSGPIMEGSVTKYVPHTAYTLISAGKSTLDERPVVHCAIHVAPPNTRASPTPASTTLECQCTHIEICIVQVCSNFLGFRLTSYVFF